MTDHDDTTTPCDDHPQFDPACADCQNKADDPRAVTVTTDGDTTAYLRWHINTDDGHEYAGVVPITDDDGDHPSIEYEFWSGDTITARIDGAVHADTPRHERTDTPTLAERLKRTLWP